MVSIAAESMNGHIGEAALQCADNPRPSGKRQNQAPASRPSRSLCLLNVRILDTHAGNGSDAFFVALFCLETVSGNQLSDIPV